MVLYTIIFGSFFVTPCLWRRRGTDNGVHEGRLPVSPYDPDSGKGQRGRDSEGTPIRRRVVWTEENIFILSTQLGEGVSRMSIV